MKRPLAVILAALVMNVAVRVRLVVGLQVFNASWTGQLAVVLFMGAISIQRRIKSLMT